MHAQHALVVALAVLAVPLAGALPQHAAPQAHDNANTHASAAPVADLPAAAQDADEVASDADEDAANEADAAEAAFNETADDADEEADESAEEVKNASAGGPQAGVPANVPAHVTQIHALITQFLHGTLDGPLGPHVSDVARPGNGR